MRVVFRKWRDGEVIALFIEHPCSCRQRCSVECYQHIGQHGNADYNYVIQRTKPASREEAQELIGELTAIGYEVEIRRRRSK